MRTIFASMLVAWLAFASPALAQTAAPAVGAPPPPPWVQTWAEETFAVPIAQGRASQAAVAVITPGAAPLIATYGTVGANDASPIAPDTDQFLIASVTKTFTALAIAQLLADGRIASLDDPANTYLKRIQLPDYDGEAVTIRRLLTHTAGFEERGFAVTRHGDAIPVTPEEARARIPAIVRTPGRHVVYANIDPAILGMVVEDLTGQTMQDYLRTAVLEPLGMGATTLNYAPNGGDALVRPWRLDGAGQPVSPQQRMNAPFYAPTGSIQTTPADMARLMSALLGAEPSFVSPGMRAQLFTPLAGNHDALNQLAMAFFVDRWNDVTVVEHAGAFADFNAWLVLAPDRGIGFFAAWAGGPTQAGAAPIDFGAVRDGFLSAALGPHRASPPLADQSGAAAFVGRYWSDRRPFTTPEVLVSLPAVTTITQGADGLFVDGKGPFRLIAPNVIEGPTDGASAPARYALEGTTLLRGSATAQRVSGLKDPGTINLIYFGAMAASLLGFGALFWRRGVSKWLALALPFAGGAIAFAGFWPGPHGGGIVPDILAGDPVRFHAMFAGAIVSVAASAALAVGLVQAWRTPGAGGAVARYAGLTHRFVMLAAAIGLAGVFAFVRAFTVIGA